MSTLLGMGKNRTGIKTSPIDAKAAIASANEGATTAELDVGSIARVRATYAQDSEPVGSVPPPTSLTGIAKTAGELLTGKHPVVFLDKLAQRLAFERTGTRLYDSLLDKIEAVAAPPAIAVAEIRRFRDEEHEHMRLVARAIRELGGDETVQTPSADLDGVAATGLVQIIADPRTTVVQSLHALHIAELADNDGWTMLIALADHMGRDSFAEEFTRALQEEIRHLESLRGWMRDAVFSEVDVGGATKH